ncbi:MAG: hypothetical protein ACLFNT_15330 [Spirochaetales bacterium]
MNQVFLLSIVTIVLASLSLGYDRFEEGLRLNALLNRETFTASGFRFGLGLVTFLVGFFRLLLVTEGDTVIVGDLLPALAGMVLGATLIIVFYNERSTVDSEAKGTLTKVFVENASNFAIAGLIIALLHFLLPQALFL